MSDFVHLHNHSYYSLLSWVPSPTDLAKKAKEQGAKAVGLTDFAAMYWSLDFYLACKNEWIKAIIWCEVFISPRALSEKSIRSDWRPHNLVLIAENNVWYKNLIKLSTIAHLDWMYYKPRIDYEVLEQNKEGLIAIDSWVNTKLSKLIAENWSDESIKKCLEQHISIFWKDNLFLAILDHKNTPVQLDINEKNKILAKEYWLGLVVTQNSFYLDSNDAEAQDVIVCIWIWRDINDHARFSMIDEDYSLKDPNELIEAFSDYPEAVENTVKIAERCNLSFDLWSYHIPNFIVPEESWLKTSIEYFRKLCIDGLKNRYESFIEHLESIKWEDLNKSVIDNQVISLKTNDPREDAIDNSEELKHEGGYRIAIRFEHEFKIIQKMWFESYFLMVADYVNWALDNWILVGPWRWSWAWSIMAYATWITNLDPLKYGLLFERFLNPERISMPDFDVDFADERRDEVIEYVTNKYWEDKVAQISTFWTLTARAAIKDVWRTYWISFAEMNEFSKLIPDKPWTSLDEAWEAEVDLRNFVSSQEKYKKTWEVAKKLEWNVRHISVHACAVVIADKPLENYTALQHPPKDDKTVISQFSAKPLDKLWLLKMDFLWLKNLSILERVIKIIKKTTWRQIVLDEIAMDDQESFKLFQRWETTWLFQFESAWMKRYLKDLKPTKFEDLIAMNSLYRPGPMEFIPKYIEWKFNPDSVKYPHKSLRWILEETYWIAVYQEQILQIAQIFSWYSLWQADILRRAIWKKIAEEMDSQRNNFINWAKKLWNDETLAKYIFDEIVVPFAWYWFNKSHAAAYSMIAYHTAYLKAHYPTQFMTWLLTSDNWNNDRIAIEISECTQMGIDVLPPDVNESFYEFTYVGEGKIRFWLSAIKNLWDAAIEFIIEKRGKDNVHFKDVDDFLMKIDYKHLNKKNIEALISSGALDSMCERNSALQSVEGLIAYAKEKQQSESSGQVDLFSSMGWSGGLWDTSTFQFKKVEPLSIEKKLDLEKEFLGLFVSQHPLAWLEVFINKRAFDLSLLNIEEFEKSKKYKFCWLISDLRIIRTKKWDYFSSFKLETPQVIIETVCFPANFKKCKNNINDGKVVLIDGWLKIRNWNLQLVVDTVTKIDIEKLRNQAKEDWILWENTHLKTENIIIPLLEEGWMEKREEWEIKIPYFANHDDLENLKNILISNPWDTKVEIALPNWKRIKPKKWVELSDNLKARVIKLWNDRTELEKKDIAVK